MVYLWLFIYWSIVFKFVHYFPIFQFLQLMWNFGQFIKINSPNHDKTAVRYLGEGIGMQIYQNYVHLVRKIFPKIYFLANIREILRNFLIFHAVRWPYSVSTIFIFLKVQNTAIFQAFCFWSKEKNAFFKVLDWFS